MSSKETIDKRLNELLQHRGNVTYRIKCNEVEAKELADKLSEVDKHIEALNISVPLMGIIEAEARKAEARRVASQGRNNESNE